MVSKVLCFHFRRVTIFKVYFVCYKLSAQRCNTYVNWQSNLWRSLCATKYNSTRMIRGHADKGKCQTTLGCWDPQGERQQRTLQPGVGDQQGETGPGPRHQGPPWGSSGCKLWEGMGRVGRRGEGAGGRVDGSPASQIYTCKKVSAKRFRRNKKT